MVAAHYAQSQALNDEAHKFNVKSKSAVRALRLVKLMEETSPSGKAGSMTTTLTSADQSARAAHVAESAHSGVMEGFSVTPETHADADSYVEGTFDADELVARTRARYGLS